MRPLSDIGPACDDGIYIRMPQPEKRAIELAAGRAGIGVSQWVRRQLKKATRRVTGRIYADRLQEIRRREVISIVNVRLPQSEKSRIEVAAARANLSVNSWSRLHLALSAEASDHAISHHPRKEKP